MLFPEGAAQLKFVKIKFKKTAGSIRKQWIDTNHIGSILVEGISYHIINVKGPPFFFMLQVPDTVMHHPDPESTSLASWPSGLYHLNNTTCH